MQLRRFEDAFRERGARVVAVSPAGGPPTGAVCEMWGVPFRCLGDPGGEVYDAFGLERGRMRQIFNLRTFIRGAIAFFRGSRQGRAVGDRSRLPGAFIVDTQGVIRWAWRGRDASDHANGAELLVALDRMPLP